MVLNYSKYAGPLRSRPIVCCKSILETPTSKQNKYDQHQQICCCWWQSWRVVSDLWSKGCNTPIVSLLTIFSVQEKISQLFAWCRPRSGWQGHWNQALQFCSPPHESISLLMVGLFHCIFHLVCHYATSRWDPNHVRFNEERNLDFFHCQRWGDYNRTTSIGTHVWQVRCPYTVLFCSLPGVHPYRMHRCHRQRHRSYNTSPLHWRCWRYLCYVPILD